MALMATPGLRKDDAQFLIYDPNTVTHIAEVVQAAALVMFGAWLERRADKSTPTMRNSMGTIGVVASKWGEARKEINAGLAPNDVSDELVRATRMWDVVDRWISGIPTDPAVVESVLEQFAGAMAYLDERTHETGTNHPRWNSRIVSGQPCKSCGR